MLNLTYKTGRQRCSVKYIFRRFDMNQVNNYRCCQVQSISEYCSCKKPLSLIYAISFDLQDLLNIG